MSWKFLYFFAKVHALAHFTYDADRKAVHYSFKSAVYGCIWAAGYFLELVLLIYSIGVNAKKFRGSDVLYFVHALELSTIVLKALFIYILQIKQSKDVVVMINDAIRINQVINDDYRLKVNVHSKRFQQLYNRKKWCLIMQFVLLFTSFYIYVQQRRSEASDIVFGFLVVYTHFSTVAVCNVYFYGSLLFGYDFYYFLNKKLKKILKKVQFNAKYKIQIESYWRECDELDKLSLVYTRINLYIAKINRLSVVQITGELLGAFVMITSSLFYMFYALLHSTQDSPISTEHRTIFFEISNSVIYCLVFFSEIYLIISISDTVTDEADNLSNYIHRSVYISVDDRRFTQCVQQLSSKAFFENPKISPLGMFTIDRPLFIGMATTIASYLIILIQFQLDRNKQRSQI